MRWRALVSARAFPRSGARLTFESAAAARGVDPVLGAVAGILRRDRLSHLARTAAVACPSDHRGGAARPGRGAGEYVVDRARSCRGHVGRFKPAGQARRLLFFSPPPSVGRIRELVVLRRWLSDMLQLNPTSRCTGGASALRPDAARAWPMRQNDPVMPHSDYDDDGDPAATGSHGVHRPPGVGYS